jgi:membrane protease YdiL (CAAX protease family)
VKLTLTRDQIRLGIWLAITTVLAIAAFYQGAQSSKPDRLTFFDATVPEGAVSEAIILLVPALLLARGDWSLLALRRPKRLWRTILIGIGAVVGTSLLSYLMAQFGDVEKEQGILPDHWIHGHTGAFVASFIAIAVFVPIIEELFFRGTGLGLLLRQYGPAEAILVCGCMFALVHGLVLGFLPLAFLGAGLALMRWTSGSTIPGIVLHGTYNSLAVIESLHWLHL